MSPEYTLTLLPRATDIGLEPNARLASPMLDAGLYPDQTIPVLLERGKHARSVEAADGSRAVESLQLRSIERFLLEQALVRETATAELTDARRCWLRLDGCTAEEMWSDTTADLLYLPCADHERIVIGHADTESIYGVNFAVGWDDEHGSRALKFRDGAFVDLGMIGD